VVASNGNREVAKVRLTPVLARDLKMKVKSLNAKGGTVKDLLLSIDKEYPGFKDSVCDENWGIRKYVNVFVNGENIKDGNQDPMGVKLTDYDEVYILTSVAGGT
jgi:molybdopterin synthase sulfur carrier subunit